MHWDCDSHGVEVKTGASFVAVVLEAWFVSCAICLRRAIVNVGRILRLDFNKS